jgi:hypothetical protein
MTSLALPPVLLSANTLPLRVHARGIEADTSCTGCLRTHAPQTKRLEEANSSTGTEEGTWQRTRE